MNHAIVQEVREVFNEKFGGKAEVFRSPGRVNIIGEHTDYNEGFVLPAAIDKAIYAGISRREDQIIRLYSVEFGKSVEVSTVALKPSSEGWPNYILGVVDQMQKRGITVPGFDMVFHGDIPIGSGMSSSAAVECATAFALNQVFDLKLSKRELAFIGQKAEHEFVGVMCGIMDQFASVFGKKDHVIKLDCRSLAYNYLPLDLKNYTLLLLNTNVKHSLASSEYNTRRHQCEEGVSIIKNDKPQVQSLRDVSIEMLNDYVKNVDPLIYKRCRYVVDENRRLLEAAEDLVKGDLESLGKKLYQTHHQLSRDYEVSCAELDFLVDQVKHESSVLGARMMGGGFGGCTINIIEETAVEELVARLAPLYKEKMNLDLTYYIAKTDDGSSFIPG
jgi:galactokinase